MSKAAWVLAASLCVAVPASADPSTRPAPPATAAPSPPPKARVAVSPILNANTREIMMPGKGMPKTHPVRSH